MLRRLAFVALLLAALLACRSKESPRGSSSGAVPTRKPTSKTDRPSVKRTPPIRDTSVQIAGGGLVVHARLLLSKLAPEDGVRVALSVASASALPSGAARVHDWPKTLHTLRVRVTHGGDVRTLRLAEEPRALPTSLDGAGDLHVLWLDGAALSEERARWAWSEPQPELLKRVGPRSVQLTATFHVGGQQVELETPPLAFEVVEASETFGTAAALQAIAGKSLKWSPSRALEREVIDDLDDNRWFRFTRSGPGYDMDVADILVSPAGKVVDSDTFSHFTCITAGTLVSTPGGAVPIEELALGDSVWSLDLERGRRVATRVRGVVHGRTDSLVDVAGLRVTAEHPVYANGAWTRARDLPSGSSLLTTAGPLRLGAVAAFSERRAVVDLSVEYPHNFFAADILVHNKAMHVPLGSRTERWRGVFARALARSPAPSE